MTKFKKGQFVIYYAGQSPIEALVKACHRDGSCTVEARHHLKDGMPSGFYLGYRFRIGEEGLTASPPYKEAFMAAHDKFVAALTQTEVAP